MVWATQVQLVAATFTSGGSRVFMRGLGFRGFRIYSRRGSGDLEFTGLGFRVQVQG